MPWADYDEAMRTGQTLTRMYGDELRVRSVHPLVRLNTMRRLNNATREVELQVVRYARESGASWADIGRALGVTRQGARQRFAKQMPADSQDPAGRTVVLMGGTSHWV